MDEDQIGQIETERLEAINRKLDYLGMLGGVVAGLLATRLVYYTAVDFLNVGKDLATSAGVVAFFVVAFLWGRKFFDR